MTQTWRKYARSPFATYKRETVAAKGIVSSNHPIASTAGLEMLANEIINMGNYADAPQAASPDMSERS